jgi:L-amino acid N-acyltransferase YncA
MDNKALMKLYLETLSEKEMKAYIIAKNHLGTSFQLEKSVGFKKWKKEYETTV